MLEFLSGFGLPLLNLNIISRDGCSRQSNRLLRGLTKRPVFLDPHIEALHAIKGIAAKGIPKGSSAKATVSTYPIFCSWLKVEQLLCISHNFISFKLIKTPGIPNSNNRARFSVHFTPTIQLPDKTI